MEVEHAITDIPIPAIQIQRFRHEYAKSALPTGYFESHPVGEIIRSFFFSSILWMLLAITLYGVYSMVVAG